MRSVRGRCRYWVGALRETKDLRASSSRAIGPVARSQRRGFLRGAALRRGQAGAFRQQGGVTGGTGGFTNPMQEAGFAFVGLQAHQLSLRASRAWAAADSAAFLERPRLGDFCALDMDATGIMAIVVRSVGSVGGNRGVTLVFTLGPFLQAGLWVTGLKDAALSRTCANKVETVVCAALNPPSGHTRR